MDVGHYVNSPAAEGRNSLEERKSSNSGVSRVLWVAGVGFGLLCMIHSALNICLRIQGFEFCNKSELTHSANVTLMSTAAVSTLLLENDQLAKGNRELQANNSDLTRDNEMLKDQLSHHQDHVVELQNANDRLEMRLAEFERKPQCCPLGWTPYKSSCYQLSTETRSWTYAKKDCEAKGSHLVFIDDEIEKEIVHTLGSYVVWLGLAKRDRGRKTWRWLNGARLNEATQLREVGRRSSDCAYSGKSQQGYVYWVGTDCTDKHRWVCEKELK